MNDFEEEGDDMKKLILLAAVCLALIPAVPASAAPREAAVNKDTLKTTWTGATTSGANASWFGDFVTDGGTCNSTEATAYCDETLVKVDIRKTKSNTQLKLRIDQFGKPSDDFDLRVYESNANGDRITYLGSPAGEVCETSPLGCDDPRNTAAGDFETKIISNIKACQYYLVQVVYFAVVESNYRGSAELLNLPPQPADDDPTPPRSCA